MAITYQKLSKQIFDYELGKQLKRQGMSVAEAANLSDLELARTIARTIAKNGDGTCDADQVGRVLKRHYGIDTLGPAAGSLFKGEDWEFTGDRRRSARAKNHAREIKVWRLR